MDSIYETQRQTHEEIERYEHALAEVLLQAPTVHRNITRRDRKAAEILDRIVSLRESLVRQYEDAPGLRPVELTALTAPPGSKGQGDDLEEFYARFEKIKDFHRAHRDINPRSFLNELDTLVKGDGLETVYVDDEAEPMIVDTMDSVFSGEEAYGKHLDLYYAHSLYLNLEGTTRLSYIGYLDMLRQGMVERHLDMRERSTPAYLKYLETVFDYIIGFFNRALPLINVQGKLKEEEDNFASSWEAGQIGGWGEERKKAAPTAGQAIWCGYCQKHYAKQTVYDAHLKSPKHIKKEKEGTSVPDPTTTNGASGPSTSTSASSSSTRDKYRAPARLTFLICALLAFPPLPQLLLDSRSEVERRMALTAREREAELEEADEAAPPPPEIKMNEDEEEEDDGTIYNPLKLPLGWDGKPIPVWLWKLHGVYTGARHAAFDGWSASRLFADESRSWRRVSLRDLLRCSISGSEDKSPILCLLTLLTVHAFDKHFQENKHTFGMRALGLPNTKHFHGITKIADALALAEKLKREGREEMAHLSKAEEVEDSDGNVYSRATYEALKKQGVL